MITQYFKSGVRNKAIRVVVFFAAFIIIMNSLPNEAFTSDSNSKRIVIIGNKELPFDSLSRNELKDIFYCRKTMWNDNQKIEIAILEGRKIHQKFIRYFIRETSKQDHNHWKSNLLPLRNCPSIMFRSEKSMVSHVALTKGAIGYVSSYTEPAGVKVIKITETY